MHSMTNAMRRFLMTAALAVLTGGVAQAGPVVDYSTGSPGAFSSADASLGWSFTVNSTITVGALDSLQLTTSTSGPQDVRIYDGGGTVLASAIVSATDPIEITPGAGPWNSHAITPVTLTPGAYFIAQDIPAISGQYAVLTNAASVNPAVTFGGEVSAFGFGQKPTGDVFSGALNNAYFGPNFDPIGIPPVPEPATLVPALTAVAFGLGYAWRRQKAATVRLP
jgi:hypothetical protein